MLHRLRPARSSVRVLAAVTSAVWFGIGAPSAGIHAQTTPPFEGAVCQAPPTFPEVDTWPVAPTISLGTIATPRSVTFTRARLLQNASGPTALTLVSVESTSTNGGTITGADPYVYTPAAGFTGNDSFTYEISDTAGETTDGVVIVTVVDVTPPAVHITAPAAGTVSGIVTITATALARDAAGNTTTSAAVLLNVANTTTTVSSNGFRQRIGAAN